MTGYKKIKQILTSQSRMTVADIAKQIGMSRGHTGRVLVWMEKHGDARRTVSGNSYIWSA